MSIEERIQRNTDAIKALEQKMDNIQKLEARMDNHETLLVQVSKQQNTLSDNVAKVGDAIGVTTEKGSDFLKKSVRVMKKPVDAAVNFGKKTGNAFKAFGDAFRE